MARILEESSTLDMIGYTQMDYVYATIHEGSPRTSHRRRLGAHLYWISKYSKRPRRCQHQNDISTDPMALTAKTTFIVVFGVVFGVILLVATSAAIGWCFYRWHQRRAFPRSSGNRDPEEIELRRVRVTNAVYQELLSEPAPAHTRSSRS